MGQAVSGCPGNGSYRRQQHHGKNTISLRTFVGLFTGTRAPIATAPRGGPSFGTAAGTARASVEPFLRTGRDLIISRGDLATHLRPSQLIAATALLVLLATTGCESGAGQGGYAKSGNPFSGMKNPFAEISNPFTSKERVREAHPPAEATATSGQPTPAPPKPNEPTKPSANLLSRLADARSAEEAERLDDARAIYQQLIVQFPNRPEPYHRLGVVADRQKRHRAAEALYAQAIRRTPADPEVFNDLGYCYFRQGKLEKAESALRKAVACSPSNSRYRNNLGMVYGHQGRHEQALEEFRHAGSESDAQYNLAFVLASRADFEGAEARLRLALAADPTYESARRALKSFEEYDENPAGVSEPIVESGSRWIPHSRSTPAQPQPAAAPEASPSSSEGSRVMATAHRSSEASPSQQAASQRSTIKAEAVERRSTQSLLQRARAMMDQRMSSGGE